MPNPAPLVMQRSRSPSGARRGRCRALLASPVRESLAAPRRFVVCVLLVAGAAACTGRDADEGTARYDPAGHAAAPSQPVSAAVPDTLLASADVYAGWRSFNINCQSCHGLNAVASEAAPDLLNSVRTGGTVTRVQFHEVVRRGRMARGMPSWDALLDSAQIDRIYAYLVARSSGALGAGQPSVGGE